MVFYCAGTWLYLFTGAPWWLAMLWVAGSALYAVNLLALVTKWRGWGRRLWEFRLRKPRQFPPYRRPRDPRLVLTVLIVAPLALLSDAVLLIVLLSR